MSVEAEVASVLSKLFQTLDNDDAAAFADCWCEDVQFQMTTHDGVVSKFSGRQAIISSCESFWTGKPSSLRHVVGAVWVEALGPNRVRARFYCQYFNVGATQSLAGMGEYRDELIRGNDGRWRVATREHLFLTPLIH